MLPMCLSKMVRNVVCMEQLLHEPPEACNEDVEVLLFSLFCTVITSVPDYSIYIQLLNELQTLTEILQPGVPIPNHLQIFMTFPVVPRVNTTVDALTECSCQFCMYLHSLIADMICERHADGTCV